MDFETEVKLNLYKIIAQKAVIPDSESLANNMQVSEQRILEAFKGLAANRLLVLEPGQPTMIRMAPPFSGVETPFRVVVGSKYYFANCVWDAFGIAAALKEDAMIHSSDGYSNEQLTLEVKDNLPVESSYVAHFAVPAAHWWDDIIHT